MSSVPGVVLDEILPEITLLTTALAGLTWGMFLPRARQWLVAAAAAGGGTVAFGMALASLRDPPGPIFNGVFTADTATALARAIILASTVAVIALSVEHTRGHAREAEYYVLLTLSSLGAIGLAAASDLMLLVMAYLLSSVPLYMLAAFRRDTPGTEAALKVYLMAAMMGVLMLFGLVWLYGAGGDTLYSRIGPNLTPGLEPVIVIALIAGFGGLLFKIAAVPGHFWLPDAAEGAPPAVAAFLTTVPKIGGLVAAGRLLATVFPPDIVDWPLLVAIVAAMTMTLGNLAALTQPSARRLLGYSAIAQAGYLLTGVAALARSDLAPEAILYYLAAYAAMNLGAWAVVVELPGLRTLTDYSSLARDQPGLALSLVVVLLSLAGIPPLGGFFGKLLVFSAAWDAGLGWLVAVAAANVVASLFYYLRWIAPMYTGHRASYGERLLAGSWAKGTAYTAAVVTVAIGLAARVIVDPAAGTSLVP